MTIEGHHHDGIHMGKATINVVNAYANVNALAIHIINNIIYS